MSQDRYSKLEDFVKEVRKKTLFQIATLGIGHVGGCMSIVETIACLYGDILKLDPKNPNWKLRDRFVLSKGHAGPAMYAALALRGFFPMEELETLNKPGTRLPSHTDHKKTPGVDMTTGSLAQGMSSAVGIALACKKEGIDNYVFCLIGDGESQEGQVWEAATFAAHYGLNRFILLVDKNGRQLDGFTDECMSVGQLGGKFQQFGFNVIEVKDGHNVKQICEAVEKAKLEQDRPTAIILNTIKAYGCPAASRIVNNHNMKLSMADYEEACQAIDAPAA